MRPSGDFSTATSVQFPVLGNYNHHLESFLRVATVFTNFGFLMSFWFKVF
ncbi:Uncharacterized protein APZ42_032163 [Daphnia magna]|uniref:Uncharacterized protein n=1 Tax=Daphnia magna TaxID=35525 RepID=A0A164M704_9CRUS|nr:Uncharacterized protein APZ42_032163 [Daphnia magna]